MRGLLSALLGVVFAIVPVWASDLNRLARDFTSRYVEVRIQAVRTLGTMKTSESVELLIRALTDREPRVRSAAASALWQSGDVAKPAIPALENALADSDLYVVACAAGALIALDVPRDNVADPLRTVLRGGDPHEQFLAARLLTGVEPAGNLVPPIVEYLRRNLPDERLDPSSSIARRDNFALGAKALVNLGKSQDRTQIDPLVTRLRGARPALIPPILHGLGELNPPPDRWVDTLIGQLPSSDAAVRMAAVELLGQRTADDEVRASAPAVARLTRDSDERVRGWVLRTLEEGKGLAHEAFGSVLEMIRSERDDDLRARAAGVAGEIGDAKYPIDSAIKAAMGREALPILTAAIEKDPDGDVRSNALRSLGRLQIEPSTVAPILARAAVEGKTPGFRTDALIMLGHLGGDATQATSMIEPLTRDPDPNVARIAQSTLASIQSTSPPSPSRTPGKPAPASPDPAARERGLAMLREYDVSFTDGDFARALRDLDRDLVEAFLDAGMSPGQRFRSGVLPLQFVLGECSPRSENLGSLVTLLVDRGADPNGADDNGNTILMTAAKRCDGKIIEVLIEAGANVHAKNTTGSTAIESAIPMGNISGAAALVAAGARLTPEQAKMYRDVYKDYPKALEVIAMASKK